MKNYPILFCIVSLACMLFFGCAKIPSQSVDLSTALKEEGFRMHQMNITLVNYAFDEKKHMVNEFIANEYAPAFTANFMKLLPPDTDVKREMPEIIAAINPRIDATRDSLLGALHLQKTAIIQQLNADYQAFDQAFSALHALLSSAAKLNAARASVYDDLKKLSNNKIDLPKINNALNQFITGTGAISERALLLTTTIQSILKQ